MHAWMMKRKQRDLDQFCKHDCSVNVFRSFSRKNTVFTIVLKHFMPRDDSQSLLYSIVKLFVASHKDDRRLVEKALDSAGLPSHKNDEINASKFEFQDFFNFYFHLVHRKEIRSAFSEK